MEAPAFPVLNGPIRLSLQLTNSHQGLSLGTLKVQDLHSVAINQFVLTINEVEVTTHNCASNPSSWLEIVRVLLVNYE